MAEIIKRDDLEGQLKVEQSEEFSTSHFVPSRGVIPKEVVGAREEAAELISRARAEAQRVLNQAKQMKDKMAQQVEMQRQKGLLQGKEEGLAQVTELITAATTEREKMLADAEPELVRMVFQIAEKILGDAIEQGGVVNVAGESRRIRA